MADTIVRTAQAEVDRRFMQEAIDLACRIPTRPWPNPPVGAVIVSDGEVVGRGAHLGAGQWHAERVALGQAGDRAAGATLYCTLEPCDHHGRTPPCTGAILDAGIARVVFGVLDPNPVSTGGGARLAAEGLGVVQGVHGRRCLELIWPFLCSGAFARPYVELKTATSLDGRFGAAADPAGRPVYLTGSDALDDVHQRRRWMDLVLVGRGTARADSPRLDIRRVAGDGRGPEQMPAAGCLAGGDGGSSPLRRDRWLVFHAGPEPARLPAGAEPVACPAAAGGRVDPAGLLEACRERDICTVMVEGGPRTAASFLAAGAVDRWIQYVAPTVTGDGPGWPPGRRPGPSFTLTSCEPVGRDLCVVWDRRDFAAELARLAGTAKEDACSPD
jgi:diaminohydroxyphosphoribosylaminopyrimidine deaminase/5-amino-6-(5-phosphoribosylamino)uracil reductase